MVTNKFNIKVDEEMISGIILKGSNIFSEPNFIFFHGAGSGIKERVYSIAQPILRSGMNILSIDFSGHGNSSGALKKSSLKKRVNEARAAINQFTIKGKPLTVCGVSMGGYIAIKMLEFYKIDTLILFCPAIYDAKAYNIPFDAGFTEIIRTEKSWLNTDVLPLLATFTGKLLIIIGEKDEVIPMEVIRLIMQHTNKVSKRELYIIPGCPHKINTWILDYEQEQLNLQQKIIEYIEF